MPGLHRRIRRRALYAWARLPLQRTGADALILAFLAVSVASIAWSTRSHRGLGPLVASLAGSAAVVTGRLVWTIPAVVYAGIALLMGASLWNLWLKRPRSKPLVQIEVMPREESNT